MSDLGLLSESINNSGNVQRGKKVKYNLNMKLEEGVEDNLLLLLNDYGHKCLLD